MDDLRAVMDPVGSEKAVLFGISEGGPMCALFAATYPERTRAVVTFGTYAKRIKDDEYPWAPTLEQREAFFETMRREWGGPVGIDERAPSMAENPEFRQWWAEYLRMGASPGAAVALTKMNAQIDVRHVLPHVRVPTLVMHRRDDRCLKVEEGRYVAALIPNSRFVEFEGEDHLPFVGNQREVLDTIELFVREAEVSEGHDRVLATVVNVRIADMEAENGKRGAEEWEAVRARAREYVRKQLDVFKGRMVSIGNGEVLAAFDGPARAIRCAEAIVRSAERIGVAVRTGVHTGECDVVSGTYGGFAVDLARRIADGSEPGKVIVSRTVKDLVAGSGLEFEDYGVRRFDGSEGEWRLFSVK
jgi:class 3 adenylate cyclase/esterase/lipase